MSSEDRYKEFREQIADLIKAAGNQPLSRNIRIPNGSNSDELKKIVESFGHNDINLRGYKICSEGYFVGVYVNCKK